MGCSSLCLYSMPFHCGLCSSMPFHSFVPFIGLFSSKQNTRHIPALPRLFRPVSLGLFWVGVLVLAFISGFWYSGLWFYVSRRRRFIVSFLSFTSFCSLDLIPLPAFISLRCLFMDLPAFICLLLGVLLTWLVLVSPSHPLSIAFWFKSGSILRFKRLI